MTTSDSERLARFKEFDSLAAHVPIHIIKQEPEKFIIAECIPACKILWDKNIHTYMASDFGDNDAWIELDTRSLSKENLEILKNLRDFGAKSVGRYHEGTLVFEVEGMGKHAQNKLVELAELFKMQDVPQYSGYYNGQDFLFHICDCYKTIKNDKHIPQDVLVAKLQRHEISGEEYMQAYDEPEYRYVFDETKVTKSIPEYMKEKGLDLDLYDQQDDRIYFSQYYKEQHLKYVNYQRSREEQQVQD